MSFWNLSKPSVAAVNGPGLAGGFELMMGCDLAVAIETAVFGDTIPPSIFCCDAGGMVVICAGATGYSAVMHCGYGSRSQFETEVRWRYPTPNDVTSWSMTPLDKMLGNLTPSGLHFERHHGGIPTIDPAKHMLFVHGMVGSAKKFSMADLKRFPSVTRKHFIECSGNGLTEWNKPTLKIVQGTHGLLSTSEWTGVQFSTIARELGFKDGAAWVLAEGADAAVMTRSIPMEKMLKDALIVYGQNGEALRPEQGYPIRLLLPGYEGNTHIKWLRRMEVSDKPFMTREETSKYTDLLADGKARMFSLDMDAKSVITFPSGDMKLPGPGFYSIQGFAWTGRGRMQSVDVGRRRQDLVSGSP